MITLPKEWMEAESTRTIASEENRARGIAKLHSAVVKGATCILGPAESVFGWLSSSPFLGLTGLCLRHSLSAKVMADMIRKVSWPG